MRLLAATGFWAWATATIVSCSSTEMPSRAGNVLDAAANDAAAGLDSGARCQDPLSRALVAIEDGNVLLSSATLETVNLVLEGTVSAHGRGVPAMGVPGDLRDVTYDPLALSYIRVAGAGHDWTLMLRDIAGFGVDDGRAVSAEVTHRSTGYSAAYQTLSLRVAGEIVFYYGLFGPPETGCRNELDCAGAPRVRSAPEGFRIQSGRKLCDGREGCGDWSLHAVELEVPGGAHAELLPGEQRSVGDFSAFGDDVWDGALRCVDGLHSRTQVVLRRTAADLL